jgi:hypothetical protein
MGRKLLARIGDRHGLLVVSQVVRGSRKKQCVLVCTCDCGNVVEIQSNLIRRRKSCGCQHHPVQPKLAPGASAANAVFSSYIRSAAKRGISFNLTKAEFMLIASMPCYYCGAPPSQTTFISRDQSRRQNGFTRSGIDRWDTNKGYTVENSRPCCSTCNYAKRQMTAQEYFDHCSKVAIRGFWSTDRSVFD